MECKSVLIDSLEYAAEMLDRVDPGETLRESRCISMENNYDGTMIHYCIPSLLNQVNMTEPLEWNPRNEPSEFDSKQN